MPVVRVVSTISLALVILGLPGLCEAQRAGRRVVTLDLLTVHASFFHGEEVIIHADAVGENVLTYLVNDNARLLALDVSPPLPGTTDHLEIIGTFYDVGRLDPDDPRTNELHFARLAQSLLNKPWPTVGELRLIVAASSRPLNDPGTSTLRAVALSPERHVGQGVTVTGRFRGRNLYGDLPDSPGESPYDFVLTSADAAIWVVGKEPKGDGFDLDVQARVDTGRWLEVTGSVRLHQGMVIVDAGVITLSEPAQAQVTTAAPVERRQGPAPSVIFSTPLEGDTDVPTDTMIRVQFSRNMDPESFIGRVRVSYPQGAPGVVSLDGSGGLELETAYRGRNRVLEIRLAAPLAPFTPLQVDLFDGITASDGAELAPWSLSFFSGL